MLVQDQRKPTTRMWTLHRLRSLTGARSNSANSSRKTGGCTAVQEITGLNVP